MKSERQGLGESAEKEALQAIIERLARQEITPEAAMEELERLSSPADTSIWRGVIRELFPSLSGRRVRT